MVVPSYLYGGSVRAVGIPLRPQIGEARLRTPFVFSWIFFGRIFNLWVFLKIRKPQKRLQFPFCFLLQTDQFGGFLSSP